MHIVLFFTFDISLKHWKDAGLLEREVKIYKEIAEKNNFRYTFITYGDKSDIDIEGLPKNLKIITHIKTIQKIRKQLPL